MIQDEIIIFYIFMGICWGTNAVVNHVTGERFPNEPWRVSACFIVNALIWPFGMLGYIINKYIRKVDWLE